MATSKGKQKPKPITREELKGMSHGDLAKVATKRRIMASLPGAEQTPESKPKAAEIPEGIDPRRASRMRMERAISTEMEGRTDGNQS